jgi:hypothetical protein
VIPVSDTVQELEAFRAKETQYDKQETVLFQLQLTPKLPDPTILKGSEWKVYVWPDQKVETQTGLGLRIGHIKECNHDVRARETQPDCSEQDKAVYGHEFIENTFDNLIELPLKTTGSNSVSLKLPESLSVSDQTESDQPTCFTSFGESEYWEDYGPCNGLSVCSEAGICSGGLGAWPFSDQWPDDVAPVPKTVHLDESTTFPDLSNAFPVGPCLHSTESGYSVYYGDGATLPADSGPNIVPIIRGRAEHEPSECLPISLFEWEI